MRIKLVLLWLFARLSWGELESPLTNPRYLKRFNPPAQVQVHHPPLYSRFSRN
jgi:hypothetical protein